jgi:hypothetical protein
MQNLAPDAVSAGQKGVPLMDLTFENPNSAPSFQIRGISLTVEDAQGGAFAGQLERLQAMQGGQPNGQALGSQIFYVPLSGAAAILDPLGSVTFRLVGDVAAGAAFQPFRLRLPGAGAVVVDNISNTLGVVAPSPASPVDFGRYNTTLVQVLDNSLAGSLRWYPNPFAPGRESLTIDFTILDPAEATLKIYTLTGELVRTVADKQALAGQGRQVLSWDGRNGAGYLVNNGVYFGVLEAGGKSLRLKIAVLK